MTFPLDPQRAPPLAVVETIYETNYRDIPAMLRKLAGDIEAGKYGDVLEVACVVHGARFEVFGWGNADGTTTHYLLTCAARKMENALLKQHGA